MKNKNEIINTHHLEQITQNVEDKSINMMNKNKPGLTGENDLYLSELLEHKDFEKNSLDYEEALKKDNRNFWEYYCSLLKYNHPIMFSFAPYIDYNSRIIKMFLFFFLFGLNITINALFFNDKIMNKIYEDKGKFNLLYQIPQILYSTLISKFIEAIVKYLALSRDNIVGLKIEKEKKDLDDNYLEKLIKILKIKFISFFIIAFMTLIIFWYYITCFCGIYVNTQIHLIKDSILSLVLSLLLPFIIFIISGIFRIFSLRTEKHTRKYLYKLSTFLI